MASKKATEETKQEEVKAPVISPAEKLLFEVRTTQLLLQKGVQEQDRRLLSRVLWRFSKLRKTMLLGPLRRLCSALAPELLDFLSTIMDTTKEDAAPEQAPQEAEEQPEALPEEKVYIYLMVCAFLLDKEMNEEAAACSKKMVELLHSFNRRTLDGLSAKVYFFYALAHERNGELASIRNNLPLFHRTACLQHNEPGQASLSNCLLRAFLLDNLYTQADQFRLNSAFPEHVSNNEFARYLLYVGRINAMKLNYSDAFECLTKATRKVPQKTIGFQQEVHKLLVIVQLLMGEIPERAIFRQATLQHALHPYFQLTRTVRVGDLGAFNNVLQTHKEQFAKDRLYSLIVRLRHNVIKTGLRKITLSYSRITFDDICQRLNLENVADAEYIMAKAIHDGVIDAVLDHENGFMFSREVTDVYCTQEPRQIFHKNINFFLELHNDAVKAMMYPPNAHKTQAELAAEELRHKKEARKAREDATK